MTASLLHPVVLTAAWLQPEMLIPFGGLLVAFGGLLLATCQFLKSEIQASEVRLREEMTKQREETRAGEARQREALAEVKGELKVLGDKLDRLVESLLASRP